MGPMKIDAVSVVAALGKAVQQASTAENLIDYQQFHKETLARPLGIKVPVLRRISSEVFQNVRRYPPGTILDYGDALLASGQQYMRFFAFDWADRIRAKLTPADFARLERWLKRYVDNWGACDHLCGGPLGHLLLQYPDLVARTYPWRRSRSLWIRRASAVILIVPARKRSLFQEVISAAEALLEDREDLVQKGYGWMLKEASKAFPDAVFEFVMSRRDRMPRTALRYAIEKLPESRRKRAMTKS